MIRTIALAALAAATLPTAAGAADIVGDFGGAGFGYGYGAGTSVTPYSFSSSACFGKAGFTCLSIGPVGTTSSNADDYLPAVGKNTTGAALNVVDAVVVPTDALFLHPGPSAAGEDSIITYTPGAGTYRVSGSFLRLDGSSNGNGAFASIYTSGSATPLFSSLISAGNTSGAFDSVFTLGAGESLYFAVNNAGNFQYDSIGLRGSIAAVPEPATWAMMIGGMGLAGGSLRARRRKVAFA